MSKIKIKIRDAMLDALKSENPMKRSFNELGGILVKFFIW